MDQAKNDSGTKMNKSASEKAAGKGRKVFDSVENRSDFFMKSRCDVIGESKIADALWSVLIIVLESWRYNR